MIYAAKTNIGKRIANEDNHVIPGENSRLQLIAVADGMGGHAAGRRASTLAVEGLVENLQSGEYAGFKGDPVQNLRRAMRLVNIDIYNHSLIDEGCRGMGTTLTVALLFKNQYIAANVGDSRLYHYDGETLTQVTHDHSLVAVLVEKGEITEDEARAHPRRNIITRALGISDYEEADFFQRRWKEGDIVLLCSDGLHGSIRRSKIEQMLNEKKTLEEHCDDLIEAALKAGATDNITIVMAKNTDGANL